MEPIDESAWRPSGVVTLLTDFGLADPYVGVMKGVLFTHNADVRPVDLTHAVPPQDVRRAAFFLEHAWRWFPEGTVHVAVVDPGVGSGRAILVARHAGHVFVAPDNGLLDPLLDPADPVHALDPARFSNGAPSRTFHGRDLFAPAAGRISGGMDPREVGPEAAGHMRLEVPRARVLTGLVEGEVLFADAFGNLVTNVEAAAVRDLGEVEVEVAGRVLPVVETYAGAPVGKLAALVNSYDLVEIAARDGSAARALPDVETGTRVVLRRRA